MKTMLRHGRWLFSILIVACAPLAWAGSIFLTGHDPDFHAFVGGNQVGSSNINNIAVDFVTDPAVNPFTAGGVTKFLFVESKITPPSGHVNGVNGITASGFVLDTDFEHHDATTLDAELDLLGTKYAAIVVASDFGGVLTQAELDILNARAVDIVAFLNAGGGLYAMAESNNGAGLTPLGGHLGFLGNVLKPFGTSLGLAAADINGNASHSIFADTAFGLEVVDVDPSQNILTLAGRGIVPTATPAETPTAVASPAPTVTPTATEFATTIPARFAARPDPHAGTRSRRAHAVLRSGSEAVSDRSRCASPRRARRDDRRRACAQTPVQPGKQERRGSDRTAAPQSLGGVQDRERHAEIRGREARGPRSVRDHHRRARPRDAAARTDREESDG